MFEKYHQYSRTHEVAYNNPVRCMDFTCIDKVDEMIRAAEDKLKFIFPEELKCFYKELGCGFMPKVEDDFCVNRFLAPDEILDFYEGNDFYATDERQDYYSPFDGRSLIFYEVDSDVFMTIKLTGSDAGSIYYFDTRVASSVLEFIERMLEKHNYYLDL